MEKNGREKGWKRMERNGRECGNYYFIIRASLQSVSAMPMKADDDDDVDEANDADDEDIGMEILAR